MQGCKARGSGFDLLKSTAFTVVGMRQSDLAASLTRRRGAGQPFAALAGSFGRRYLGLTGTVSGSDGYADQWVDLTLNRVWNGTDADADACGGA